MSRIRLSPEGVEIERRLRSPRRVHYEEIEAIASSGRGLSLRLADGSSVRLGSDARESHGSVLRRIVEGAGVTGGAIGSVQELTEVIEAWSALPGFSAAPFVGFLIEAAVALGASDLHWEPVAEGYQLRLRRLGILERVASVPRAMGLRVVGRLKVLAGVLVHRGDVVQEGRIEFEGPGTDIRLSFVPSVLGESATARLFDRLKGEATLDTLGFAPPLLDDLRSMLAGTGVIVFSGASASGKTTTLYTALRELIALAPDRRVVTIEDPVECRIRDAVQLEVDSARGTTYGALLRSVLRQDADVIVVGEIRDEETAALAVRAGLTGHLVLTTLHAGSADEARERFADMDIDGETAAMSIRGVLSQALRPLSDRSGKVVGRRATGALTAWPRDGVVSLTAGECAA